MSRVWDIIMSKSSRYTNKIKRRKDRLTQQAEIVKREISKYNQLFQSGLEEMTDEMNAYTDMASDISMVLNRMRRSDVKGVILDA